ncbi:MAG: hypothetical protein NTW96_12020, partial [Planctomycetia bacterium]|nr:hypothetical protein [Planctomycetia bacterium]
MHPKRNIDWSRVYADGHPAPGGVEPRRRLRACLVGFALLAGVVFARAVQLEATQGPAFRREAARPLTRNRSLPGARGRILARDGSVLAEDKRIPALAVYYRYLQQPPHPTWLRSMARSRLSRAERKDPRRVAAAEDEVRRETRELASRLAELCGLTPQQWARRAAEVQARVQQIADGVNRRRREAFEARRAEATRPGPSWLDPWLGPERAR